MVRSILETSQRLFAREQKNILSAATVITGATFVSAFFGFIKTRLLLSHFSSTIELKAILETYWVALRFPELIFQLLVVGSLSAAFIPIFSKYLQKNPKEAYRISSSVMNIVLLLFIILSTIIFIFAAPFNDLITSAAFTPTQIHLAANLTRIMVFAQLLFAISSFLTGAIQAQKRFLIPALSPVAYNVGIIIGIQLLTQFIGIYAAAVGVLIGACLHLLLQLPLAIKLGFQYQPVIDLKHPGVKEMFHLMPPRILTLSVNQLELSSMVFFATALKAGSLTVLQIAQQLIVAPIRLFSVPIGQASLPFLSKETAAGELEQFKQTFTHSLHQILYLTFPASALLLILRVPLVRIVYGSRAFPWESTIFTGRAVAILSLSLFAEGAIHIVSRAFYALHNTRIPFITSLSAVLLSITLSALVVFRWHGGVLGLATAVSISSILEAVVLLCALHHTIHFSPKSLLTPPAKMLLASFITAASLWVPMHLLEKFIFDTTHTLPLILLTAISSITGMAVYLVCSYVLKIEEMHTFLALISRIGNWRKVLTETPEVIEPASQAQEVKPA